MYVLAETVVIQLPRAVEAWLLMNSTQRLWVALAAFLAVIFFFTGSFSVCLGGFWFHGIQQLHDPFSVTNAISLIKFAICLIILLACAFSMAYLVFMLIRSWLWTMAMYALFFAVVSVAILRSVASMCLKFSCYQINTVFILFVSATTPIEVSFEDHLTESLETFLKPGIVLFYRFVLEPSVIIPLKEVVKGPICAFYPDSIACNISLTLMSLAANKNSTEF